MKPETTKIARRWNTSLISVTDIEYNGRTQQNTTAQRCLYKIQEVPVNKIEHGECKKENTI